VIRLRTIRTAAAIIRYRSELVDGTLAWCVARGQQSFAPVHEVVNHIDDGLVIIISDEIFDIGEAPVYRTREEALAAYYHELA
jgi:hypothetical protein